MRDSDMPDNEIEENAAKLQALIPGHQQFFPARLSSQFPNIVEKIVSLWDSPPEAGAYFEQLLVTQRENRQGFPPEVYMEIFALRELYAKLYPAAEKKADDFWSWV